jgi:large conductance mechanosensitive channel
MLKEFKAFVLRGNVVDLAVGVIIGAAFGTVITSLVKDMITPLFGLIDLPDFAEAAITVGKAKIRYGLFVNAVISFLIVAAAVFFLVVKPLNHLMGRGKEDPKVQDCPHCLSSIPADAKVCSQCTRDIKPARASRR